MAQWRWQYACKLTTAVNLATTAATLRARSRLDITAAFSCFLLCGGLAKVASRPHTELAYSHTRRPAPWDKNQARADAYAFCATDSGLLRHRCELWERRHSEHLCGRHKQTQFETHKAIRCETRAEAKKISK